MLMLTIVLFIKIYEKTVGLSDKHRELGVGESQSLG